jgi:hypothetical protein
MEGKMKKHMVLGFIFNPEGDVLLVTFVNGMNTNIDVKQVMLQRANTSFF